MTVGAFSFSAPSMAQQVEQLYPLADDDGHPVSNERIPSELDPMNLPGLLWAGSAGPDVIVFEFFDYNCPFCRKASVDIDNIIQNNPDFRLALVNNPILAPGSIEAARVQQAVLRAYGPGRAYEFHKRLFAIHGVADRASALGVAADMQLDSTLVTAGAVDSHVLNAVDLQTRRAADLSFSATPSFALDGAGILGWPGAKSLSAMIAASRRCDRPACSG